MLNYSGNDGLEGIGLVMRAGTGRIGFGLISPAADFDFLLRLDRFYRAEDIKCESQEIRRRNKNFRLFSTYFSFVT